MPPNMDTNKVKFVKEFIATYKSLPVLWNRNHPDYKNRNARTVAWDILVKKCKEYDEAANIDFARAEIDKLRTNFRKERRKLLEAQKQGLDEVKPTLWFYKLLLFTIDAEDEVSDDLAEDESNIWPRDRTILLMKLLKDYPCLYAPNHPNYRQKVYTTVAYKTISEYLTQKFNHRYTPTDIRCKIRLVKKLFITERARVRKQKKLTGIGKPRLWCYDLLKFLGEDYISKEEEIENGNDTSNDIMEYEFSKNDVESVSKENFSLKMETSSTENSNQTTEDIYDTIGRNVTYKLRQMTDEQRQWAAKIINDIMYYGLMENLTAQSQLILNT